MTEDAPDTRTIDHRAKHHFYRRLSIVLAGVCAFLLVTVLGQIMMPSSPIAPTVEPPAASVPSSDPESPQNDPDASPNDADAAPYADSPIVRRDADDPMAAGAVDAPVVLIEWTDMRCPFCAAFTRDSLPVIMQEYVDAGLVRIEVHDVAFFGEESASAAVAGRAAGAQGLYFEYLDALYGAAPERGHADLPREKLIGFAEEIGVPDIEAFTVALDDPALHAAVEASSNDARQVGINSVPFFLLGNTTLAGAQPADVYRNYLDDALSRLP